MSADAASDFGRRFDVSRETVERLVVFSDLLLKWNRRINLISRASEAALWRRHIADAAQLWRFRPPSCAHWVDLGAGAGFPGLVIAAMARERGGVMVALVESDKRKAVFLSEASRLMGLDVEVLARRAEEVAPQEADVVSARALAPLAGLLGLLKKHRAGGGIGLFPKGATVHKEIAEAQTRWRFDYRIHSSVTDPEAAIVEVGAVADV